MVTSLKKALTSSESAALKSVWQKEAYSRSDIARLLQLSRPTASSLVKNLIDKNLLSEDGSRRPSGGKPAIQLKINSGCFHSVGVDIGYENSARVVKKAFKEDTSLKEACVVLGYLTSEEFDEYFHPERMI